MMQLIHRPLIARLIHKIAADYRMQVPNGISLTGIVGILLTILGIGMAFQSGFSPMNGLLIVVGIGLTLPRIVIGLALNRFKGIRYHVRDAIVSNVQWRGYEQVLDVGTGSGLMLFGCAKQLTTGKATGIDLFLPDSGGGTAEIFWKNAQHEGLDDRVDLRIMDARDMLFEANCFDVIVSSSALHHIGNVEHRRRANLEMLRVLKAGGRIVVFDLRVVLRELEILMQDAGFENITMRGGGEHALIFADKPA